MTSLSGPRVGSPSPKLYIHHIRKANSYGASKMAGLYAIQGGELIEFVATPYDTEAVFQAMLEKFPALLAGDLINPISPRRWLLIKREAGIPDSLDSGARWSVDHLFIDTPFPSGGSHAFF